jgi:hypothetical protein
MASGASQLGFKSRKLNKMTPKVKPFYSPSPERSAACGSQA